jgi:hypothetical protein
VTRKALFVCLVPVFAAACGEDDPIPFVPKATIASVGADPLSGSAVESCPVYREEKCVAGKTVRCAIYDPANSSFVDTPDVLLERVYDYDRWYDLYSSPQGLTAERVFVGPMPGNTPESEWSSPSQFQGWAGEGDAGIWTGAALVSDAFRYAVTRTEADYQRMENKTRALVRSFEVTGVPGYLARYHYLGLPEGTANDDRLMLRFGEPGDVDIDIENLDVSGLPEEYRIGVDDGMGGRVQGVPRWNGDPSIDQYTGPMMSFPIVHGLLRDESLKEKMAYHLTCYLKRLKRVEVINLKSRPDLLAELQMLFGGSSLKLDPDDPDLRQLDKLVWYVHPGINRMNVDKFVGTCPDKVQLEPWKVLDAKKDSFELDLLYLAAEINRDTRTLETQIDHFYVANLRGGDASHLIHLATLAYYLTGEEQYKSFLFDELLGNIGAGGVARTMMSFRLPDWCFKFYGDHITYGTHWQLLTMLPEGELKNEMIRVMEEEAWQKALYNHHSAKFNIMYGSVMPDGLSTDKNRVVQTAIEQLRDFGGNGGTLHAPRRTHHRERQDIIDQFPGGVTVRCPTEDERTQCEARTTFFGIDFEGQIISRACDGRAGECQMADGMCTDGIASDGLPPRLRTYADFMWQRSPFNIGESIAVDGQKQSPGRDLSEPYWMGRYYGMIGEGAGQVLAWRSTDNDCE